MKKPGWLIECRRYKYNSDLHSEINPAPIRELTDTQTTYCTWKQGKWSPSPLCDLDIWRNWFCRSLLIEMNARSIAKQRRSFDWHLNCVVQSSGCKIVQDKIFRPTSAEAQFLISILQCLINKHGFMVDVLNAKGHWNTLSMSVK